MSIVRYPAIGIHGVQRDLQREMNRLFDTFFPTTRKATEEGFESAVWRPMVDVHEDEQSYVIDAELPGLRREDVRINFQDGVLAISGERNYGYEKKEGENGGKERNCHRLERFYGKFHRTFTFPSAVNADGIRAKFDNGILTITVPKAETVRPRQIEIG